ncbi:MAG: tRNA epoxyqueuosine(34) reductase QueG [Rubrivivax sp.]|nr:tRNA epoxyqueuosine(34) reductase QueG [Rubrivivax sp.]
MGQGPAITAANGRPGRVDLVGLRKRLAAWAHECGFSQIGIAGIDLASAEAGLSAWLAAGFHGSMDYMARHGLKRARPAELVPGTASVITARMDYLPRDTPADWTVRETARLAQPGEAVVSLYARGRDYHKVLRARLAQLADRIAAEVGPFGHRVFTDSAPVLEVELAARAGLAWRGKHTLALARDAGSMFFLGEIFVDLPLADPTVPEAAPGGAGSGGMREGAAQQGHCGSCTACLAACPTGAIVAPGRLDARRCISYLTIELHGPIPLELRHAIGNRIYGCDDCQLVCPWNKFARRSALPDFDERPGLGGSGAPLLALWSWDEAEFGRRSEGSPIRRIGYARWRRNLAVALGNALRAGVADAAPIAQALAAARDVADDLAREHIDWALAQQPPAAAVSFSHASAQALTAPAATPPSPGSSTP